MPYLLVLLTVVILAAGVSKLRRIEPHQVPVGPLLLWAALLVLGATVWVFAARLA